MVHLPHLGHHHADAGGSGADGAAPAHLPAQPPVDATAPQPAAPTAVPQAHDQPQLSARAADSAGDASLGPLAEPPRPPREPSAPRFNMKDTPAAKAAEQGEQAIGQGLMQDPQSGYDKPLVRRPPIMHLPRIAY